MTDISDTELDEIMWANSDEGKAAFDAAWAKAKGLGIVGVGTDRVMGIDMADVGAIVWAAHQATAGTGEGGAGLDAGVKRQIVALCETETDQTGGRPLAIRILHLLRESGQR
jgi:hypothetical protein